MSMPRPITLTVLAMLAFAGNSILCRAALQHTGIDAATFTSVRLVTGAATLWLVVTLRQRGAGWKAGNWTSAAALFVYAAGFSFAYLSLSAATGALLLFGAVQATMIGHGIFRGERLGPTALAGLLLAFCGIGVLLVPGLSSPPLVGALLMIAAGVAWGVYSLRGREGGDPTATTAGNFIRATPLALALSVATLHQASFDLVGIGYAAASGALASGLGYALWYATLPSLRATHAATVQLSVPVLTALAGVILLSEPLTLPLTIASAAILGGIALVIKTPRRL